MFVALREIRAAIGRFALIAGVVALMTLLVGFVSGLAAGLGEKNVSAMLDSGAESVVFAMPDGKSASFADSAIDESTVDAWRTDVPTGVTALGLAQVSLEPPQGGSDNAAVTLFGADRALPLTGSLPDDAVAFDAETAKKLNVSAGDTVTVFGTELRVESIIERSDHAHMAVAYTTLNTLHAVLDGARQPHSFANVLLIDHDALTAVPDTASLDARLGTSTTPVLPALLAIESFKSELGSLGLMIGMLMGVSVLVVGVFFLVWTMQRRGDIAVLKALGAPTGWVARDAMAQAAIVLLAGVGIGSLAVFGLGLAASGKVPFLLSWLTLGIPALGMFIAGLLGALTSLRQVTTADPLTALQNA